MKFRDHEIAASRAGLERDGEKQLTLPDTTGARQEHDSDPLDVVRVDALGIEVERHTMTQTTPITVTDAPRAGPQTPPEAPEFELARQCARVLAHAWDHDSEPPGWCLELARQWDAYGRPIAECEHGVPIADGCFGCKALEPK